MGGSSGGSGDACVEYRRGGDRHGQCRAGSRAPFDGYRTRGGHHHAGAWIYRDDGGNNLDLRDGDANLVSVGFGYDDVNGHVGAIWNHHHDRYRHVDGDDNSHSGRIRHNDTHGDVDTLQSIPKDIIGNLLTVTSSCRRVVFADII